MKKHNTYCFDRKISIHSIIVYNRHLSWMCNDINFTTCLVKEILNSSCVLPILPRELMWSRRGLARKAVSVRQSLANPRLKSAETDELPTNPQHPHNPHQVLSTTKGIKPKMWINLLNGSCLLTWLVILSIAGFFDASTYFEKCEERDGPFFKK